jgi:serine/threonine protein kinase/WD40 repeat protein
VDYAARPSSDQDVRTVVLRREDVAGSTVRARTVSDPYLPYLPGYELLEEIGRGAMGVVYKARHRQLNRLVAVKMILAGVRATEQDRQRFLLEAEAIAKLDHSNIVKLHEIGEYDGQPYAVLEYVPGTSLNRYLTRGLLSITETATLMEAVARGVHHAHEHGVIHRDLKPGNILLRIEEDEPNHSTDSSLQKRNQQIIPKVADFGLAKQLQQDSSLTASGMLVGTPHYMAPEVAEGKDKQITPAADLFSLGAILYEMLSGKLPFDADTPMQTIMQVIHEEPQSISKLRPSVPRDLITICERCLQKDPRKRYESTLDFAEDLQRFLDGKPILARPVGYVEQIWKWSKRHPSSASLILMTFLVAIFGMPGFAALWINAEKQKDFAEGMLYQTNLALVQQIIVGQRDYNFLDQGLFKETGSRRAKVTLENCVPNRRNWAWSWLNRELQDPLFVDFPFPELTHGMSLDLDNADRFMIAYSDLYQPGTRAYSGGILVGQFGQYDQCSRLEFKDPVTSAVFGENPQYALVAFSTGSVCEVDLRTGKPVRELTETPEGRTRLAVSPDRKTLLVASEGDRSVQILNLANGELKGEIGGGGVHSSTPLFTKDGKFVLIIQDDRIVKYSMTDRKIVQTLLTSAHHLTIDPSGLYLAITGEQVTIHSLDNLEKISQLPVGSVAIKVSAFSPNGVFLATGGVNGSVHLWEWQTGQLKESLIGHDSRISLLQFEPSGKRLILIGEQAAALSVLDLTRRGGRSVFEPHPFAGEYHDLVWDEESKNIHVITQGAIGSTGWNTLDSDTGEILSQTPLRFGFSPACPSKFASISPDQSQIAVLSTMKGVLLILDRHGKIQRDIEVSKDQIYSIQWSPSGKYLCVLDFTYDEGALWNRTTRKCVRRSLWDARSGKLVWEKSVPIISEEQRSIASFRISHDETLVAWDEAIEDESSPLGYHGKVHVLKWAEEVEVDCFDIEYPSVTCYEFDQIGSLLAYGDGYAQLHVRDIHHKKSVLSNPITIHASKIAFHPDGQHFAAISRDAIRIWNLQYDVELMSSLIGKARENDWAFNPQVAWSPDGKKLAYTNQEKQIIVWSGEDSKNQDSEIWLANWYLKGAQSALERHNFQAIKWYWQILNTLQRVDDGILARRGLWYANLGHWELAAKDLIDARPNRLRYGFFQSIQVGVLALRSERHEEARRILSEVVQNPKLKTAGMPEHLVGLAILDFDSPSSDLIKMALDETESEIEHNPRKRFHSAAAHYHQGMHEAALEALDIMVEKNSTWLEFSSVWFLKALVHDALGEKLIAIQAVREGQKCLHGLIKPINDIQLISPNHGWWEPARMEIWKMRAERLLEKS